MDINGWLDLVAFITAKIKYGIAICQIKKLYNHDNILKGLAQAETIKKSLSISSLTAIIYIEETRRLKRF